MSASSRPKEKCRKSSRTRISLHDHDEESAARTRPFSLEEIMLRRDNKKLCDNATEEVVYQGKKPGKSIIQNVSDPCESERSYRQHKDLPPVVEKPVYEEPEKASSRKKETRNSKSTKREDSFYKGKAIGGHDSKSLKHKLNEDTRTETKGRRTEEQVQARRKIEECSLDNFQNEYVKKHSRNSTAKERCVDQCRGKSERERKRKYQNGDDEKLRDRNTAKKHDPGKHRVLEISERKESSKSRFEKPRLKRGRSRSSDREDRHRFSSLSPRAHKHTSHNVCVHSEISSHSLKDRSGKQHSDIDRSRVASNGSSSQYRRHGGPVNRLGGYSPRKRRIESAIKTPSPPDRSPEKKSARWDQTPTETEKVFSGSVASLFNSSNINMSSNVHEMAVAVSVASASRKSISGVSPNSLLTKKNASIDSVQLTQATRPMRRLYVENVPSSTSENTLVESLNNFLLSSGVNHIQGTRPCISCAINKEKGQAVVEFLTPEDALAALSFDGSDFSGSILKIRRPRDFIEMATGSLKKSVAAVETISDMVKDSPKKIFIGGISNSLSSEMLMEIVSVFGPLKTYHFEVNEELNEPCAFLEYVDQSITLKACAGLNGMKLGGSVLTAVQANYGAPSMVQETSGNASVYKIPEYAKPLLKGPSQVLKLRNVFNLEQFSLLSEPETEEVLEDVRLECARFGTIKSVKIVKHQNNCIVTTKAFEPVNDAEARGCLMSIESKETEADIAEEHINNESRTLEFPSSAKEIEVTEGNFCNYDKAAEKIIEEKSFLFGQVSENIGIEDREDQCNRVPVKLPNQLNSMKGSSECGNDKVTEVIKITDVSVENKLMAEEGPTLKEADGEKEETSAGNDQNVGTESDAAEKSGILEQDHGKENDHNPRSIFEPGCVFVEFGRTEASLMAAHCLHGRLFEDRIVTVEYVSLDHYRAQFLN